MENYTELFRLAQKKAMMSETKIKTINPDPDFLYEDGNANWSSEVEAAITMMSLKNLYFSESWVYIVINICARKISKQQIGIYREFLSNNELINKPAENHPLMDLLYNPNDYEGYTNFIYKILSELILMGNAIIWSLKFHRKLILLPTEIITIETDKSGKINWYNVNFGVAQEFQDIYNGYMRIHANDIIHIKLPNLNSLFWGLSPWIPGRKSILFDKYTKEFLLNFYLKQANPGPVLELTELANEKQALRLLKSMEINWTGRRNQRRTMILPKGVTAKNLQQTIAEQQLKEHLLMNRDDIRAILAIPPHELGLQNSGSLGSNETKEQIKNFWEQTLIPLQNLVADTFTNYFQKELGKRTFFKWDNSDVAALQTDEIAKADLAIRQLNFKTLNEVRKDLYKLQPVEGGDIIRGTMQQSPFNFALNQDKVETKTEDQEEEKFQEQPRSSEGFLKNNFVWWSNRKNKEDNEVEKAENKILKNLLDMFVDQAEITIKEFKNIYKERLKQDGFYPESERLKNALEKAYSDFQKVYVSKNVPTLQATSEVGYDIHLNTPFNLPSMDEIQALRSRNEEKRLAALEARAIQNFQGFSQTTTNDIIKRIEKGVSESKTLDQIADDIYNYFGEVAPNRSKTIARTETLLAVSLGQKAAEDDASTIIPGLKKMWITANDERVRESHIFLDRKMVDVGKDFKSGNGANLEFPRDPRAPANETINCRCTWLIIPPEDLNRLDFV